MRVPQFLFFDLGRVLLKFDHEIAVRQLASLGDCDADRIREVVFGSSLQAEYERGDLTTAGFCQRFREQTNLSASDQQICRAASDIFSINESVIPVVSALRQSGWPIGILSNTCDAHWSFIVNSGYGFMGLFNSQVLSFQSGSAKPDARIFESAATLAGCDASQIFFVDDLPANVQGAADVGFDAVLFTSARELANDLRCRGVRFNL